MGRRELSDHCPIWLKIGGCDWGPKPFIFKNYWFNHKDFNKFVEDEWKLIEITGRKDYHLYEKLKRLKERLRMWNKETFGWINLKVDEKIDELNDLDKFLVNNFDGLVSKEIEDRRVVSEEIKSFLAMKESMLRLK